MSQSKRVLYLPHGGGPMPLLGAADHQSLIRFLKGFGQDYSKPSAILVISAHWEAPNPAITAHPQPDLYFDYSGFPPQAYSYQYPVPGEPDLAQKIYSLLDSASKSPVLEKKRGLDHGVFVPLILMYPEADIPVVQLSLVRGLDPQLHIEMGKALANLEWDNLLIVGSGMSFHNPGAIMRADPNDNIKVEQFHDWLHETCAGSDLTFEEREEKLSQWKSAPYASFCHPREEHLIPLHVCFGAAKNVADRAEVIYQGDILGKRVSALMWQ